MIGVLSILGFGMTLLGIILSYAYYQHGNKPTFTEIASELRDSLDANTDSRRLRTDRHLVNVIDVKVSDNSEWLDSYENADQQRGYALIRALFVGKVEVISHFKTPDTPPSIENITAHPYYDEGVHFTDANSGTCGYNVSVSGQTLILNVNLFADSARKGVAAVIMTQIIVAQMIDDVLSGKLENPAEISSLEEFLNQAGREDIEYPIVPEEELSDTNFIFPD